jgi:hypothetical protein
MATGITRNKPAAPGCFPRVRILYGVTGEGHTMRARVLMKHTVLVVAS